MARHPRAASSTRPRYRRITAASSSLLVTLVAVLGAIGILPTGQRHEAVFADQTATRSSLADGAKVLSLSGYASSSLPRHPEHRAAPATHTRTDSSADSATDSSAGTADTVAALPARSGSGKRIVFDMSDQRVWLVARKGAVARTYLVSGSVTDNLQPGRYEVYSKSVDAIGVDDSGTMKYMVRFAHGTNAAIGFHDIPILNGKLVQTAEQLGTPQSHGCVRQLRKDAKALWDFAPVGTKVVVTA